VPQTDLVRMSSHAQVPYALTFPSFVRVYFATRSLADVNGQFVSSTNYCDFDLDMTKIINLGERPILSHGFLGNFDEFGIMPGSVIPVGDLWHFYYCGWSRRRGVPYEWAIGLATSADASAFTRQYPGPLVGPSMYEPFLHACPLVYRFNNEYFMFYLSGKAWHFDSPEPSSEYVLRMALSSDGINWRRLNEDLIPQLSSGECQTSPSVFFLNGVYHMLFSFRSLRDFRNNRENSYRIGYARSLNLLNWERDDSVVNFQASENPESWDHEMVAYPNVFESQGKWFVLYNGNGFGQSGFGVGELRIT